MIIKYHIIVGRCSFIKNLKVKGVIERIKRRNTKRGDSTRETLFVTVAEGTIIRVGGKNN